MKRLLLSFRQITVQFFEPLIKYPFWTVIASVIIGIALYAGVDIVLAEVVRQNTHDIHILSTEMLIELGPNYVLESRRYAETIEEYTKHMEQRNYAVLLRLLYPRYSPEKALASALSDLEAAEDKENKEAEKAILKAGLASKQLYTRFNRFSRSPIKWFESEVVSDRLVRDLDDAFSVFHEQIRELKNAQTLEAAENKCRKACRYSRRTLLLLFLARLSYDNGEKIERFLSDVEQARDLAKDFAEKYENRQKLFFDRAESMGFRAKVVKAMLANDMDRVSYLLREATEEAIAGK